MQRSNMRVKNFESEDFWTCGIQGYLSTSQGFPDFGVSQIWQTPTKVDCSGGSWLGEHSTLPVSAGREPKVFSVSSSLVFLAAEAELTNWPTASRDISWPTAALGTLRSWGFNICFRFVQICPWPWPILDTQTILTNSYKFLAGEIIDNPN